jgi:hypothetical protein
VSGGDVGCRAGRLGRPGGALVARHRSAPVHRLVCDRVAWLFSLVFRHVTQFAAGSSDDLGSAPLAQAVAFELDAVGVVDNAVEDSVGQRGVADDLVPAFDRQLAGDQQRAGVVAIFDDLEQIAALLRAERLGSPIPGSAD